MNLLRWRFGRSAPDVLSRSSGPAAGRQVMNSAVLYGRVHDAVLQYARQEHRQPARAGSRTGR